MKIIAILGGGRSGTDFLQSLFDNHSEILQFPGCFDFSEFWPKIKKENNLNNIVSKFIGNNERFFDSRIKIGINLIERHYMLGKNKDGFYVVSKNTFRENFINLFKDKEINKSNILFNLHYAYSLASGEDLSKKKIIILNIHTVSSVKILSELDYEIIYTIRNPIASLSSGVKHWLKYDKNRFTPWSLYFHIDRLFNGLGTLMKLQKKIHVIQLELLHRQNTKVMNEIAKKIGIVFEKNLTQSTFHGKLWWGDMLSGKDLNGVNPNFKNNIDNNFFYKKDIQCLEKYLSIFMIKYNYEISEKNLKFSAIKILPLKVEVEVWKKAILSMKIKEILSIFYYWVKRINLMKNNTHQNINFPESIGK